jgi:hypothetical protein
MRRIMAVVFLLILSFQYVTHVPAQSFTLDIWIDRGCGGEYHVGDMLRVHWEASHSCQITFYEKEPDGTRRKLSSGPIIAGPGKASKGWTIGDYGYGRRVIQAYGSSLYGSDDDECEFYVVEDYKEPQDTDGDGVPDDQDSCYNPGCTIVDSRGCPEDSDSDGTDDCDDDCPYERGDSSNDGCPEEDSDNDGVIDDEDNCYNPGCTIVDSRGCPEDSDSDGLEDCEDECPLEYGERSSSGCPPTPTPTPAPTSAPPTSAPPQTEPSLLLEYVILSLIAITAIGILLLVRRRQKKTVPAVMSGDRTRTYDDDTRIY